MEKAPFNKRVYIRLPKKYMSAFAEKYELDHGLFILELNPYINEGYIRAYFRHWGNVTWCKVFYIARENQSVAFVAFSTADEADRAEWAGPHDIGGPVEVKRVVSPKVEGDMQDTVTAVVSGPRRHMGLGYILEDPQWLDEQLEI
ncbi:uncharacterized protein [Antennarius striatus]|uniref:uncharacterized protein n=1 Tax=Antennarius striatus TaxID=241820 RepID=UPI0035AF0A82